MAIFNGVSGGSVINGRGLGSPFLIDVSTLLSMALTASAVRFRSFTHVAGRPATNYAMGAIAFSDGEGDEAANRGRSLNREVDDGSKGYPMDLTSIKVVWFRFYQADQATRQGSVLNQVKGLEVEAHYLRLEAARKGIICNKEESLSVAMI